MRILEVGMSYNPGGVESFVMNYYRQLQNKSVEFEFLCMYDSLAYEEEILGTGGKIHYLPDVKKHPVFFTREYLRLLKNRQFDAVHVNMLSAANILPVKLAKQAKIPHVIAHSHNSKAPGKLRNFLHEKNKKVLARYATDYWSCSTQASNWLFQPEQLPKVRVIHNAIDPKAYGFSSFNRQKMRDELQLSPKTLVLGHVGRLEEQKNHRFLLLIFAQVLKQQPDALLLLVGDGPLKNQLVDLAKELQIQEQILFLGVRTDVKELLSAMDVFVFPSLYEGLSVTAVEAQANGLPCIVSTELSEETQIGENMKLLPLSISSKDWAKEILNACGELRNEADNDKIVRAVEAAGFSIVREANKLGELLQSWQQVKQ